MLLTGPDVMVDDENKMQNNSSDIELDWSADNLIHHPDGMEKALQDNISKMEAATREIIENGSIEEIEAALEQNMRELAALQQHMQKLVNRDITQV